jgi:hypothetical protein
VEKRGILAEQTHHFVAVVSADGGFKDVRLGMGLDA